ncbi:hypothetical protein AGABI2DRAFT_75689 [Agaricus bisporus var. bisporus H97]|uniref:hypothetical protein n=1 Tax=Agaricus bisporus var. bisporus (strain H97 / ATCC MYA-4626 / FGSC 10389) TaxID=936046 RepID=UPI00029F6033|nr:hypothetical protein AGABI2DRAFT_75689 [Agaricus bisporus var. bisporus H97]EKV43948.1 hypothetical protein AGABI2DRAFT_75689 [Agaricus bisporus var. bisporus H97]
MASGDSPPVRSRKAVRLSSIHLGRRSYPKAVDFPLSPSPHADAFTPFPPDVLPEHTAPISLGHSRRNSLVIAQKTLQVPASPAFWVMLWFSLNFTLTLCNKLVLNKFPFPYSITAFHALGGCVGTWLTVRHEDRPPTMSRGQIAVLLSFSVLYTLNIVVSNVSLQLVTVPFHQVVRSSSPFFTLILSFLLLNSRVARSKMMSLIPVVLGVGLATYGDYYYTLSGFLLTLFGTFLASLKTVVTNILQSPYSHTYPDLKEPLCAHEDKPQHQHPDVRSTGRDRSSSISITVTLAPDNSEKTPSKHQTRLFPLSTVSSIPKLHLTPVQLLYLLSPLALFQCALLALYFGEIEEIINRFQLYRFTGLAHTFGSMMPGVFGLVINASMAFALNVVSFHTNRKVGALGMSVAANVKQVLTIITSVGLFSLTITGMNCIGIFLTLLGGVWYAKVDYEEESGLSTKL